MSSFDQLAAEVSAMLTIKDKQIAALKGELEAVKSERDFLRSLVADQQIPDPQATEEP